jgi:putative transcriptional regulator
MGEIVAYKPIAINRENLTIMGVPFPDMETLEKTARALGTNMFEGYEPTIKGIIIMRDYITGSITLADVAKAAKGKAYA